MIDRQELMDQQYMLDGNSAAGILYEVFGMEMTLNPAECGHCGHVSVVGEMLAFGRDMGTVLRCPICQNVLMRIAERPDGIWVDMSGMAYVRIDMGAAGSDIQ